MSRFAVALMFPEPLEVTQVAPADAAQDQVAPDSEAGNVSVIVAPVASVGPLLVATIVYVTVPPGVRPRAPSVLVIDRSASPVTASVSLAVLSPAKSSVTPVGTATEAVLTNAPAPSELDGDTVPLIANVAVPLGSSVMLVEMAPEPEARQEEPADAAQVQVTPVKLAGGVSVNVALVTVDGPALVTTIV